MLHEWINVSLFNSLWYILYAILSNSKLVSNSSGTRFELSIISILRKPECPVLKFEFLSIFFVNIFLGFFHVIVIAYFYL
jgi:hypothetical protein